MGDKITLGALRDTLLALLRRYSAVIAGATIAMTALDTAIERISDFLFFISLIMSIAVAFYILLHVLRTERLIEREGGFGRYFGASMLSGLGMMAGLLCLVLPAAFLAARWTVATTVAVTRNLDATEALRESWHMTKPSTGVLVILYLLLVVVYFGVLFGLPYAIALALGSDDNLALSVLTNAVIDLTVVLGPIFNVAVYIELTKRQTQIEAVFA